MKVSVVMCVKDVEKYIANCLQAILDQSFSDFELIIIDDYSSDRTAEIIKKFTDKRIKYFRNEKWLGISRSRNRSVKNASGEYLFFTDGDSTVSKKWVDEGLKYFDKADSVGVEGKIIYVSENYQPTFSDGVQENRNGGNFMTGNVAYKRKIVETVGAFDENLTYLEDRDLGLRIKQYGKIYFAPEMLVTHPQVILTPKKFIKSASYNVNRVRMFKKYGVRECIFGGRIYCPINLFKIFFPPLILSSLLTKKFRYCRDYNLLPYSYIYVISERLKLWALNAKERIFVI